MTTLVDVKNALIRMSLTSKKWLQQKLSQFLTSKNMFDVKKTQIKKTSKKTVDVKKMTSKTSW